MGRRSGGIEKQGNGKWRAILYMGEVNGKRSYLRKTAGTKRDAEKLLAKWLRERDAGVDSKKARATLDAWLDVYLDRREASGECREATLRDYRHKLDLYVRPMLGHVRLEALNPDVIQSWMTTLTRKGAPKSRGGVSPRTVSYAHTILSGALSHAVDVEVLEKNPATRAKPPVQRRKRKVGSLTIEEAKQVREALVGTRYEGLWLLMLLAGLRPSEACALRWEDIDLEAGIVSIHRRLDLAAPASEREHSFDDTKSERGNRDVPLAPMLVEVLRAHRAAQREDAMRVGRPYRRDLNLAFANGDGTPVGYRNIVNRYWSKILTDAGLPDRAPYDLRHSFASISLAEGADLSAISAALGHSKTSMTLDVYAHALPKQRSEVSNFVADAIGE